MAVLCDNITEFPTALDTSPIQYDIFLKEQLVGLYFYITRTKSHQNLDIVRTSLGTVLDVFKKNLSTNPGLMPYFKLFYRMVGQTRDMFYGKGEHELTYMMLWEWYKRYPVLAIYAVHRLVLDGFGSWRDIKYLCHYLKEQGNKSQSFVDSCVKLMNQQLRTDLETWKFSVNARSRKFISNVAKWIPREHKKFDWLYELLVIDWAKTACPWILSTTSCSYDSYLAAKLKCKRLYRKQVSLLNKALDTTQIKLCSNNRDNIIPANVSSYTLMKQPKLLFSDDLCSQNFKIYLDKKFEDFAQLRSLRVNAQSASPCTDGSTALPSGGGILNGVQRCNSGLRTSGNPCLRYKHLPLSYFVKQAMGVSLEDTYRMDLLNHRWNILSKSISNKKLENLLPILDMGYSIQMNDAEAFYTAIGLAILVAERTTFGKRILVIDNKPCWVNLEDCATFVSMVKTLDAETSSKRSTYVDFNKGMDMVILGLTTYNLCDPNRTQQLYKDVENLRVILFSNFDDLHICNRLIKRFTTEFASSSPQFIFWNLGKNNIENTELPFDYDSASLFLSGFSPSLISSINRSRCSYDTPYSMVSNILNNERYACFENYIDSMIGVGNSASQ